MDTTRPGSPQTSSDRLGSPPPIQDKISAYYSLVFPHFTFYIQTLSITIGRRCATNPNTATTSAPDYSPVDVDLGALKSVSRLHAKIEYDQDEDRFVLVVIGRNGAWVDGVWSGGGSRAPLCERSEIQIASRTFEFVLPPPPPPDDTPSPSSQSSSANRQRSPSVDITSISPPSSQPSHSPAPPVRLKLTTPPTLPILPPPPPPQNPQPQLPNSNAIGKSNKALNMKKRKKSEVDLPPVLEKPTPEGMPPKPPFTYAQLIYRAIQAIKGKATLQEICAWISNTYEYYRYADSAWMSSVRHNLSSGRSFVKMERCGGDRGKGFFWCIDEKHAQSLRDQETKNQQGTSLTMQNNQSGTKEKGSKKKEKGKSFLEPPLKRSARGEFKGSPLPPPLTSVPLASKTAATNSMMSTMSSNIPISSSAATGIFAYPAHPHHVQLVPAQTTENPVPSLSVSNPYAALTQTSHWGTSGHKPATRTATSVSPPLGTDMRTSTAVHPGPTNNPAASRTARALPGTISVPDVVIPIVLGPIPPTHLDYSPIHPNNSAKEGYMVLHERKLILDPDVFSGLTTEMLGELEKMGARAALVVLTGHMIRALKERRARGRGKERGTRRSKGAGRRDVVITGGPATANAGEMVATDGGTIIEAASPIVIVDADDSGGEGPVAKKRRTGGEIT